MPFIEDRARERAERTQAEAVVQRLDPIFFLNFNTVKLSFLFDK